MGPNAFEQWRDIFRAGLERMRERGHLGTEAAPARPAAIDHVRAFAVLPDPVRQATTAKAPRA